MMMKKIFWTLTIGGCLIVGGLVVDGWLESEVVVNKAEARVGRPLTPTSAAGVARRTTRRRIHRTNRYIASLPKGCTTVVIDGTSLYQCSGTYYQAHSGQYVVVNVE